MKLKVYQQGGGLIYTPFIPEQQPNAGSRTLGSGSDEDSKLDPLDKELLALMKDQNLLPSDVNQIFAKLIAFQKRSQSLSTLGDGSYRSVMPGMLQIMQMVSNARYNKSKSDDAIRIMSNRNTGADVALDKYGRMYVQTMDGKIEHVAPSEYDSEKYRPISNSELLYLRENSLPFDTDILSDISETVGLSEISQEIARIIKDFGKTKSESYYDKNVVEIFTALNSPNGIYKLTEEKTSADLQKAWNVIYKQLPTNMQHVLNARAALSGSDPVNFIHEIVLSNLDYSQGIDYDSTQSKAAGFGAGSGEDGEKLQAHDTYQYRFGTGQGLSEPFLIAPTSSEIGDKATYSFMSRDFGPMLNWNQLPLDPMNLQKMFFSGTKDGSALSSSVDTQSITFGNHPVEESERPTIFYNGNSGTSKVWLPWKDDNGHIRPDFEKLEQFNDYMAEIKGKSNLTPTERNAILAKYDKLSAKDIIPSEDGKSFTIRDTRPFLAFSAYAGQDTLKLTNEEKRYLRKLDKSEGRMIKDAYNNFVKYDKAYGDKKKDSLSRNYRDSESNDFWEGIVFVYAKDSAWYAFNSTLDEPVTRESLTSVPEKVMANDFLLQVRNEALSRPDYDELSKIGQHY